MSSPEYIVTEKWSTSRYAITAVAGVLVFLLVAAIGYYMGNRHSVHLITENDQLNQDIVNLNTSHAALEEKLVMQEQINKVEQAANAEAGQSLDSQMLKIRELERELTFYRNILAPGESDKGLQVSQFVLTTTGPGSANWQVSLLQAGSQGNMMQGLATVDLIYLLDGQEQRMEVLNSSGNREFGFKFRYFQHLTGVIDLADNITPIALEVRARQYGTNSVPITKRFDWSSTNEQGIANVGQ